MNGISQVKNNIIQICQRFDKMKYKIGDLVLFEDKEESGYGTVIHCFEEKDEYQIYWYDIGGFFIERECHTISLVTT